MSQKIFLVRYLLEDNIPIDDTSENLLSTYIPDDLLDWLIKNEWAGEINIKESEGDSPSIPVTIINEDKTNCFQTIVAHIENQIINYIKEANKRFSDDILISKEIDSDFKTLLIWLKIRELIKEKEEQYINNSHIKIVIG